MEKLENINVGDSVILHRTYDAVIARVVRTTKAQIEVNGCKFRKSDGHMVGVDCWSSTRIEPYSEERANEIMRKKKRNQIIDYLNTYSWKYLSDEKLEQIYNILQEGKL